jgi:hypothetical protein
MLLLVSTGLFGQVGGLSTFMFLDLPTSARITGLADHLITVRDADVSLAFSNPGVLNPTMHGQISFNHAFLLADVQHGYVGYGHFVPKWQTTLHSGVQYINYGDFSSADLFGNINGTFDASEYAIAFGAGKQLYERLSVGVNAKLISSQLESYNALAVSTDIGATFHDTSRNIVIGIVMKNWGTTLQTYTDKEKEPLPRELQVAFSKQLRYLPFRFSVIYRYLNRWNILYDDPNTEENTFLLGALENANTENVFVKNLFRHFVFNGEFLLGKKENLRIRLGYNTLRGQELKVNDLRSLAGFSFGVGMKVNRFRIDYGQGSYHLAGSNNHFSISTNIAEFK